jgi:hypothetical protein
MRRIKAIKADLRGLSPHGEVGVSHFLFSGIKILGETPPYFHLNYIYYYIIILKDR